MQNFAKDTGDYQTLSKVDMMVIAAGVRIAKQKAEFEKLRTKPKDLDEFRPERLKEAYDAYSSSEDTDSDQSSEDEKQANDDD